MNDFKEEELLDKIKQIELDGQVEEVSYWKQILKTTLYILGAFVVIALSRVIGRHLYSFLT